MIILKDKKYIVMDTDTKEIISEHLFDESRGSDKLAKEAAYESNARWKEGKINKQ